MTTDKWEFRKALERAGYTQGKLAEEIEVTPRTLSKKVTGESDFTISEVKKICEVLHIEDPLKVFFN